MSSVAPCLNRLPCLFGQLKPNGMARFALHDARPGQDMVALGDILHAQANQVASAQLAVDGRVKEGQIAQPLAQLQRNPDPQISWSFRGGFCPMSLPFCSR